MEENVTPTNVDHNNQNNADDIENQRDTALIIAENPREHHFS